MRPYRALVVDDEIRWREVAARSLSGNFQVDAAASIQEARAFLDQSLCHVLILDISMDEGSAEDRQGWDFLSDLHANGLTNYSCVIILSGFGTSERIREGFVRYGIADFLSKGLFDNRELQSIINRHLTEKLKINLDLEIFWHGVRGAEEACLDLRNLDRRIKRDDPLCERLGMELEDLLCRLFYDASEIIVQPMPRGHSGTGVLRVQSFHEAVERSSVVRFGEVSQIEQEEMIFKEKAHHVLDRSPTLEYSSRTPLLGGLRYSLLGAAEDFDIETSRS